MSNKIFNQGKDDYGQNPSMFLGQDVGLLDTVNKRWPDIWDLYKSMKSLDWDPNEFDYSSCADDFRTCDRSIYDMMIKTLAYQWEADSIASRISPIVGCLVTSSELWTAWQYLSMQEGIHASTYSEIIRNSFEDPSEVLEEILGVEESFGRLSQVAVTLGKVHDIAHKYALGLVEDNQETYNACIMFTAAMLVLERVQFMSSFAVTFAICDTGLFQPIGKAVQKICQDEWESHVALDLAVLRHEFKTERGKIALEQCKGEMQSLLDEVIRSEFEWVDYLFSEGRELVGMNSELLKQWTLYCAKDVVSALSLEESFKYPTKNPLKFMENWININKNQGSPQEEDVAAYKVNIMRRDDEGVMFTTDF